MNPSNEVGQTYTTAEVAALLRIDARTVRRLAERGELRTVQTGCRLRRYPRDDVHRLMRGEPIPA